ncbi:MAG: IS5 family transposase [Candidatus Eisenbacteria bacterium]|nr:IS5 family transposase [Candidatus Eisenbacteria bacterium]
MMGTSITLTAMFHYTSVDQLVPADDPLRAIESVIDWEVIRERMAPFYSPLGRSSIPPEQLLKAMLIGYLFGITSERRLMRELQVNQSYRRFLDLESEVWHPTTFTKNRNQRFKEREIFRWLFDHVVAGSVAKGLVTGHHVSQDGTLVRANCSFKSIEPIAVTQSPQQYRERVATENPDAGEAEPTPPVDLTPRGGAPGADRNPEVNFRGEQRRNATHRSKTDPDARLARRSDGQGAYPGYHVHYAMDNKTRFTLDVVTTRADGRPEPEAGRTMLTRLKRRHGLTPRTLGADKGYFVAAFLDSLRRRGIKPHVACPAVAIKKKAVALREWAKRKTRGQGYALSQRFRKRIEELFGEAKDFMGLRRMRLRTLQRVHEQPLLTALAQNLKRLVRLTAPAAT